MDRKKLPIGVHDFAELIANNYYFVDKSLLIKELLDSGAKVTLLPRPRRFGKTVNMSMIRYFFEKTETSKRHFFDNLKITQYPNCMAKQGQYPVIFLTFKDIKESDWTSCQKMIKSLIAEEFRRHNYLLQSPALDDIQKKEFSQILDKSADIISYKETLTTLTAHLHKHYKERPLLLIDEYDAPLHAAAEYGYYDDVVNFMRGFLSGGLKDNSNLEFGILTGILRIAKESIFSGLNNLRVCTFLQDAYSDKFGLLETEVKDIITYFGLSKNMSEVKSWYDGYQSGSYKLYNPWSIFSMLDNNGLMKAYWTNTSGNALLKQIIQQSDITIKKDFEQLVRGSPITKTIDENVVMPELYTNEQAVWSVLLMSGYLTFENYRPDPESEGSFIAELKIPNTEVASTYREQILAWFKAPKITQQYQSLLRHLVDGDVEKFKEVFTDFALQTLSFFDVNSYNPENFYHGLVLGMLASLRSSHEVSSNRESGLGRYDVSIFPKDPTKPGIIIEFKVVHKRRNETLESCAQDALKQLEAQKYEAAMRARGITSVIKYGISFNGKETLVLVG